MRMQETVMRIQKEMASAIALAILVSATLLAASLDKAVQDTESRRRAAESGLKQIGSKSAAEAQSVRGPYDEAANANNAWLDEVARAIEQPGSAAPNVAGAADKAASAFVKWVAVRNRALGEFELAGAPAEAVKKKVIMDLTDIAAEAWKSNRTKDQGKRTSFVKSLSERVRWKTSDQLQ
jgi:hypothetical protein